MDKLKEFLKKNKTVLLSVVLPVAIIITIMVVIFAVVFTRKPELMTQFEINTGVDKMQNGTVFGNPRDSRFNFMRNGQEKFLPERLPADRPNSNVYAMGQMDYDWLTWRPAHIRDLEMKERSVNIMHEPLIGGGYDAALGPRDIYSYAEYAMHPANLPEYEHMLTVPGLVNEPPRFAGRYGPEAGLGASRSSVVRVDAPWRGLAEQQSFAERMENKPVAQSDNTHVFQGPPGYDVTTVWTPSENLSNQGQWNSQPTVNPDVDVMARHAQREAELGGALYGL